MSTLHNTTSRKTWNRIMGNLVKHAKREFIALGYTPIDKADPDDPNSWIQQNILELLETFANQGHSGTSAPYCINYFKKLAAFEPLCPLTGEDNEWQEVGDNLFQNIRCSSVFKQNDHVYNIDGKVFREPNGACYTNCDSRTPVTFPYTPVTEYVDVKA